MDHLKFEYFSFYSGTVEFYLGRGATWVVGLTVFDGCGLSGLICF